MLRRVLDSHLRNDGGAEECRKLRSLVTQLVDAR